MVRAPYISDVRAVLARRHDNGSDFWATADGRLGVGDPFSTVTSLLILHELKVPGTHEAVKGAIDLLMRSWRDDGRYHLPPGGAIYPCHTATAARVLCRFGPRILPLRRGRGLRSRRPLGTPDRRGGG